MIFLLSLCICLLSGCDIQIKHYIYLKNGYIYILLSVLSYWDAHGHTNTTRNNTKRSLLKVQGQLFRIKTVGASLLLAFFVLMPHVFNYALTGFNFFFLLQGTCLSQCTQWAVQALRR